MTKIVGILNVTPDSFSDGGKFNNEENALKQARIMVEQGADVIDVGAQSTRPNAIKISPQEEWSRLEGILPKIIDEVKKLNKSVLISLDSFHFEVIEKACEFGIDMINDVDGLKDEKIVDLVIKTGKKAVFMHNLPILVNEDILINKAIHLDEKIYSWAKERLNFLLKKGVKKSQLIFDPGIGFNKDAEQSIRLLKNIENFKSLDIPVYVGHSKKRFLDVIYKNWNVKDLDLMEVRAKKTLLVSQFLAAKNVDFIRVHDVVANKKTIFIKKYP
jgi:dihydropteroate synthase